MLGFYLALIESPEEKKTFERIYKEYRNIMYNNAYKILKDKYLAEDAVHNAFLSLIKSSKKIKEMKRNEICNYLLIINRNVSYAIYNEEAKNQWHYIDDIEDVVVSSENIEIEYEILEDTKKLFNMIKELETNYSDVLVLKLFYNMSDTEIANALNITVENVRVRFFRGKNKLRKILKKELQHDRKRI